MRKRVARETPGAAGAGRTYNSTTMRPRFIVDAMLGTLARWLRLMGYDALYERSGDDSRLAAKAARLRRVLVTRDRGLAARRGAGRVVLLRAEALRGQWVELARSLRLRPPRASALTRCGDCNRRLEALPRPRARPLVPPYVYSTRRRFRRCPGCGRIFWRATHASGIEARLRELAAAGRTAARGADAAAPRRRRRSPGASGGASGVGPVRKRRG
jgi:hypothetical protein